MASLVGTSGVLVACILVIRAIKLAQIAKMDADEEKCELAANCDNIPLSE
jgi:hypothetical protein